MALPVLAKTWQFQVNGTLPMLPGSKALIQNTALVFAIKNGLVGFGTAPWVVRYSCNSVTAGTAGDGVDRWATVANLVWNNAGAAHSWMVLRQTGIHSTYEILLSLEPLSSTNLIVAQSDVGFTGGTTTARPTATDEYILGTANMTPSILTTIRTHFMQSTDGAKSRP